MREIHLDGGEISIIKALGFGGSSISGDQLAERISGVEEAELIDSLKGLITMGYVTADRNSFHSLEDLQGAQFHVNPGYSKALREAVDPRFRPQKKSRRVRRE